MGSDWWSANSAEKYATWPFKCGTVRVHQVFRAARAPSRPSMARSYSARNSGLAAAWASVEGGTVHSIRTGLCAVVRQSG